MIMLISVDLRPWADQPTIEPASTVSETLSTARNPPKRLVSSVTTRLGTSACFHCHGAGNLWRSLGKHAFAPNQQHDHEEQREQHDPAFCDD